ncbi:CobW family GTP-binding protein [Sulfitobacter donghicola]|uniref:Cobalamin biosynthesis protein P47K n=1 Tax=Sulfitobacter donghicola DSW-25 = KCTC 12864 = JCM 14565 TaxID=1300350 RepID=A0A073IE24_9RHOB|nr:GTP-binding protein [Sulfitobacter donghicola]KEJ87756.1 cobalamin biosynthesis protein P47K [Sulfitobacter donghicola DSW-25 = KCTC 12864 = JCM 14565]KIN66523.1 putative GTPase [Sulfitobacter donghicola DSW-25 = KCTC 12864 = JCM 14565]
MTSDDTRIPVTLLTGFLGAGKTTLLNHLIRDPDAGRVAVIMNEFGDVGLDHDLIEEATEETVLLQSGCLCCAILGDLAKTLEGLIAKRKAGQISFDRVVIETSGIAEPAPIVHTLATDFGIAQAFRLDGVVTLADAATGMKTLDQQFEAVNQIAMADVIILSKTDLVDPFDLSRFEKRLDGINTSARRIRADQGCVPMGTLFGLSAMRTGVSTDELDDWLGIAQETVKPDPLAGLSGLAPAPAPPAAFTPAAPAAHDHRINSASITVAEPIPANVFDFWLDTLIALRGPNILRMKGILHVEGLEYPFIFHGVQHIFDAPVPFKSWSGTDTTSRVVIIARDMAKAELEASLEMLLMRCKAGNPSQEQSGGMMVDTTNFPY